MIYHSPYTLVRRVGEDSVNFFVPHGSMSSLCCGMKTFCMEVQTANQIAAYRILKLVARKVHQKISCFTSHGPNPSLAETNPLVILVVVVTNPTEMMLNYASVIKHRLGQ